MKSLYKYIPYEKLTLETSLSKEEVNQRIRKNTTQKDTALWNWSLQRRTSDLFFTGVVTEKGFELNPNISYRNSFLPTINVEVESLRFGSTIELKLQLNLIVKIFGLLFISIIFIVAISTLIISINMSNPEDGNAFIVPLLMFVFVYAMFWGGFKYESVRSRKFLKKLLEAEEVHGMQ